MTVFAVCECVCVCVVECQVMCQYMRIGELLAQADIESLDGPAQTHILRRQRLHCSHP